MTQLMPLESIQCPQCHAIQHVIKDINYYAIPPNKIMYILQIYTLWYSQEKEAPSTLPCDIMNRDCSRKVINAVELKVLFSTKVIPI